jgi:hypothetical protein
MGAPTGMRNAGPRSQKDTVGAVARRFEASPGHSRGGGWPSATRLDGWQGIGRRQSGSGSAAHELVGGAIEHGLAE